MATQSRTMAEARAAKQTRMKTFACSQGWLVPAGRRGSCMEGSRLVGQYHCLESDTSCYREPVEVAEERGHVGELWQVEHEACCYVLDALQKA